ncbi:MAG: VCBS repeat-containing protein, partial [Pyrinomonadaceae bacterium]
VVANDNFANAQLLTGTSGRLFSTSNVGATKEVGEPNLNGNPGGKSVWFKWVGPAAAPGVYRTYSLRIQGVNQAVNFGVTTGSAIYTGPSLNALTLVTQNYNTGVSELNFAPAAGVTYYLQIDGYFNNFSVDSGTFTIEYGIFKDKKMADFDHDGRADIAVYRPSTGMWYSIDSITDKIRSKQFGANGDIPMLADFGNDGELDVAVYRPSSNTFFVNSTDYGFQDTIWGSPGDIPVIDYDQILTSFRVFRPSDGNWYVPGGPPVHCGQAGDVPVLSNFNVSGQDQFTVFRPSTGTWYSQGGNSFEFQFGLPGDKPVVADYDGDGRADVAVFRPSGGTWWIRFTATGAMTGVQWGLSTVVPQPADFDGDGKVDIAVFRDGTWYILQSQSGSLRVVNFGLPGDIPVSSYIR